MVSFAGAAPTPLCSGRLTEQVGADTGRMKMSVTQPCPAGSVMLRDSRVRSFPPPFSPRSPLIVA